MQVKKFEAPTMKEALQLVKQELGPDAIILSAKDHKKSFGLVGRGSIEITAAISERSAQQRKFVENKLPETARDKFKATSARQQKVLIQATVDKYQQRRAAKMASAQKSHTPALSRAQALAGLTEAQIAAAGLMSGPRKVTSQRYIDITEEEQPMTKAPLHDEAPVKGRRVDDILQDFAKTGSFVLEDSANVRFPTTQSNQSAHKDGEIKALRQEVDSLRSLLSQFQGNGLTFKNNSMGHPGADYGLPYELSGSFERLAASGIDTRFIVEILDKANKELSGMEKKKKALVDAWVARYIMSHIDIVGDWFQNEARTQLHLFVGSGGHGKTSALVKMASRLVINDKKKVVILTADTFKVGAGDQLKIYAQILNVPFETVKHAIEFPKLLSRYRDADVILVDYPGFALKDINEIDQLRALMPPREVARRTHLVMSCASKDLDAYEICHRYQATHFDDLIVTKLDESYVHGFLYNIQRKTEKPLYAFGIGPKIPEDIELATRERVLDLIYKITKKGV